LSRTNSIAASAERFEQYNRTATTPANLKLITNNANYNSAHAVDRASQRRRAKLTANKHKQLELELDKLFGLVYIRLQFRPRNGRSNTLAAIRPVRSCSKR
jgi:hypothetical protein